ncbi:MAG TPA: phosphatase domain-containing protein [Gemmatimonadaceae bacterium]|jgi:phosphatidate phosphatase APP1
MSPSWRDLGKIAGSFVEDAQRLGVWALAGSGPSLHEIAPYRGFGTTSRVLVQGRAMRARDLAPAGEHDNIVVNLINTYKRVDSNALPHARVSVRISDVEREIVTDDEGFFREWIDLATPLVVEGDWHPVHFRLLSPLQSTQPDVRASGRIRIPRPTATFGVISDLDDTVIQSRVANFLQAARTIMLGNARTRLPFAGVAAFYRALECGGDGSQCNPIFYVSSSPWNIHDVITEFLSLQKIPDGPVMLRDWDLELSALASSRLKKHKEPLIREILDAYPTLPFVLIGDTSQQDPEIYREIVRAYPGRILAIYIRNVDPNPERLASVQALAKEVLAAGSSLVLADDTAAAAKHALEHGWITAENIASVEHEKKADEGKTGTKADAPGVPNDPGAPTIKVE